MLNFNVIGNLAADAEVKNFSSGDWVTFRVAHNFKDADGKDRTQWVSCMLKGSGGKLLDYLKKGQLVFVCGRGSARVFSSHITKAYEVGLDVAVDRLELLSMPKKVSLETIKEAIENKSVDVVELKMMLDNETPF